MMSYLRPPFSSLHHYDSSLKFSSLFRQLPISLSPLGLHFKSSMSMLVCVCGGLVVGGQ